MRDAIGGSLSISLIIVFMVVVNAYLAFNVNYTKAYRVKNEIRSIIEKHEGLTCEALDDIGAYMNATNYTTNKQFADWCKSEGYTVQQASNGRSFCMIVHYVDEEGKADVKSTNKYKGAYYSLVTFVSMDIPIFNKFMALPLGSLFAVKGETAIIYSSGTYTELSSCGIG